MTDTLLMLTVWATLFVAGIKFGVSYARNSAALDEHATRMLAQIDAERGAR